MTAENLHDALNLLPSDLLTATDKLRRAPKAKPVPWIRVVSLAACVAVVICGSFFMCSPLRNKAAMAEPMMQQSVAEAPAAAAPMAPYPVEGEVAADEAAPEPPHDVGTPEISYEENTAMEEPAEKGPAAGSMAGITEEKPAEEELCIDHSHSFAEESDRGVNSPGYCGNMLTTVYLDEMNFTLAGSYSVTITDILINLDYDPDEVCRCMAEFTVDTEMLAGIEVNLTEAFARCERGQAALTETQVQTLREIIDSLS